MKHVLMISAALLLGATGAMAQTMSKDEQIAQAVKAAPEALRAGATVVNYDAKGDPVVLRQGNNGIVCTPNQGGESFSVNCYGQALRAQRDLQAKDKALGKDAKATGRRYCRCHEVRQAAGAPDGHRDVFALRQDRSQRPRHVGGPGSQHDGRSDRPAHPADRQWHALADARRHARRAYPHSAGAARGLRLIAI